jgi:hypothetical protein
MEAEEIVINKIKSAFPNYKVLRAEEIEANPYILEETSPAQLPSHLAAFMVYVLLSFRSTGITQAYDQLLNNLSEYSKCKSPDSEHLGIWFRLAPNQRKSILSFLNHMLHNQRGNIDEEILEKIIGRWNVT